MDSRTEPVAQDLTQVFEMGRGRAAAFRQLGITSCEELCDCDPERAAVELHALGVNISVAQIEQMRFHAQSYREGRAILFGPLPPLSEALIALDLEYDLFNPRLWLIGLYLVDGEECEHLALWADDHAGERDNLKRLAQLLDERPELPVLTWAGTSADLPQLNGACKRLGLKGLLDSLDGRHVDLFAHARRSLRLPIPELALGEVAAFFGVAKSSSVSDGREASALYSRYLSRYSPRVRKIIKDELIAYNRDDLEALVRTLRIIQALPLETRNAACIPAIAG